MKALKVLLITTVLTTFSVAVFAQDSTKHKMKTHKMHEMKYSCPMHPEVTSDKPGKCSKCGMDMKKMEEHKMAKAYCCAMHPEVTSDKPGKCSKCGTDLIRSKKEQMKMEVMKMYSCPTHTDVTSDKPGKCSKCGMDMVKKHSKQTH
jgi:Heavy metal binding domain